MRLFRTRLISSTQPSTKHDMGLLAVKYERLPSVPRYSFSSNEVYFHLSQDVNEKIVRGQPSYCPTRLLRKIDFKKLGVIISRQVFTVPLITGDMLSHFKTNLKSKIFYWKLKFWARKIIEILFICRKSPYGYPVSSVK